MSLRLDFVDKWTVDQYRDALDTDEQWDLKRSFMLAHCESFPVEKLLYFTEIFCNITFRMCPYPASIMTQVEEMSKNVFTSKHAVLQNSFYKTLVEVLRSEPQSHIEGAISYNETRQQSEETHDNYSSSFTNRNQDSLFDQESDSRNMTELNIQSSKTSSIKKGDVPEDPSPIREDRGGSILDTAFQTIYGDYVLHEDEGEGLDNSSMTPNFQSISSKSLFSLQISDKHGEKSSEYHSEMLREAAVEDNSSIGKTDSDLPLENHCQLKNPLVTVNMIKRIRSILEEHRQSKNSLTTSKTPELPAYDNRKSTSVNNTNLEKTNITLEKDNGIDPDHFDCESQVTTEISDDKADEPLQTKLILCPGLSRLSLDLLSKIISKERDRNSLSREPDQKVDESRKNNHNEERSDRACKKEGRSDSREPGRYSPERGYRSRKDISPERGQPTRKDISLEHGHYSRKDKSPESGHHIRNNKSPECEHHSREDKSSERGQHTRKDISPERGQPTRKDISPEHGHYSRKDKSPESGHYIRNYKSPELGQYTTKNISPERGQPTRKDVSPEHGLYSRKDVSPEHGLYSRKDKSLERGQHTRKDISPERGQPTRKDVSPEHGLYSRKDVSPERGLYSRKEKSPERGQHTRKDISPEHGLYSRKDKSPEHYYDRNKSRKLVNDDISMKRGRDNSTHPSSPVSRHNSTNSSISNDDECRKRKERDSPTSREYDDQSIWNDRRLERTTHIRRHSNSDSDNDGRDCMWRRRLEKDSEFHRDTYRDRRLKEITDTDRLSYEQQSRSFGVGASMDYQPQTNFPQPDHHQSQPNCYQPPVNFHQTQGNQPEAMYPKPQSTYPQSTYPQSTYPQSQAMYPKPQSMYPQSQAMYPQPQSMYPKPQSMYPKPQSMHHQPEEMYPQSQSMYPQSQANFHQPQSNLYQLQPNLHNSHLRGGMTNLGQTMPSQATLMEKGQNSKLPPGKSAITSSPAKTVPTKVQKVDGSETVINPRSITSLDQLEGIGNLSNKTAIGGPDGPSNVNISKQVSRAQNRGLNFHQPQSNLYQPQPNLHNSHLSGGMTNWGQTMSSQATLMEKGQNSKLPPGKSAITSSHSKTVPTKVQKVDGSETVINPRSITSLDQLEGIRNLSNKTAIGGPDGPSNVNISKQVSRAQNRGLNLHQPQSNLYQPQPNLHNSHLSGGMTNWGQTMPSQATLMEKGQNSKLPPGKSAITSSYAKTVPTKKQKANGSKTEINPRLISSLDQLNGIGNLSNKTASGQTVLGGPAGPSNVNISKQVSRTQNLGLNAVKKLNKMKTIAPSKIMWRYSTEFQPFHAT